MKKNARLTFSAIMSALAVIITVMAYFPYLTYALPAMAGLAIMAVLIETDKKWAVLSYICSALILVFIGEMESKILYISFFGYYPILKAVIERLGNNVLEWIIKLAIFNAVIVAVYSLFSAAFGIQSGELDMFGKYGIYILLAAANFVFVLYDICVSRMAMFYLYRIHRKVQKIFRF